MKVEKKYYNTLEDLLKEYPKKELTGREKDWTKENPINNLKFLCRINFPGKDPYWAAQCLCCKKFSYYRASHIANKSIRCCVNENIKIGALIGKLTILSLEERTPRKIWKCQCSCKNKTIINVREDSLTSGNTLSCGCYNKENNLFSAKDYSNFETEYYIIKNRTEHKGSNGAYLWDVVCKKCQKHYLALPNEILKGRWNPCFQCWHIQSKGEKEIQKILQENNILFEQEYPLFKYFVSNRPCKVDFYVNNEYVIEYDGYQHFSSKNWDMTKEDFNNRKKLDMEKNEFCFNNNIPIIRIPYIYKNITLDMLNPEKSKFLLTKEKEEDYFNQKGWM